MSMDENLNDAISQLLKKVENGDLSNVKKEEFPRYVAGLCDNLESYSKIRRESEFQNHPDKNAIVELLASQCATMDAFFAGLDENPKSDSEKEWAELLTNDRIRPVVSWLEEKWADYKDTQRISESEERA